jgi:hypothetical protein
MLTIAHNNLKNYRNLTRVRAQFYNGGYKEKKDENALIHYWSSEC